MDPYDAAGEIAASFAATWNRHDMDEFGRLFHEDASFVNVIGMHMRGRPEIQQAHTSVHAGPYRDSSLVLEVAEARELAPNVVVAVVRSALSGDERAPGEIRQSVITMVLERRETDNWKIMAAQNTMLAVAGAPRS
jgi:uncharacterized protein (TIGR02246 family)